LLLAAFPTIAAAQCNGQWDVSGPLRFSQSDGHYGTFNLVQDGATLSGDASESVGALILGNPLEGRLIGNNIELTVYWTTGAVGEYRGTISPAGWIVGDTHDAMNPNNRAQWRGEQPARCIVAATPATEPEPPRTYIEHLGKAPGDFGGQWVTVANGGTWSFDMIFAQNQDAVSGTYRVRETGVVGEIRGNVIGNTLTFEWFDRGGGRYAGNGKLRLAADGKSFDGTYTVVVVPLGTSVYQTEGTWHGER
jgi:hypothetical protein